jgi:hypothetical protein
LPWAATVPELTHRTDSCVYEVLPGRIKHKRGMKSPARALLPLRHNS